jgi:hypothetical protein
MLVGAKGRRGVAITVLAIALSGSTACSTGPGTAHPKLPICTFKVGDTIRRDGVGAVVPDLGKAVNANADFVNSGFAELTISTTNGGIVTVHSSSSSDSSPAPDERCQLIPSVL